MVRGASEVLPLQKGGGGQKGFWGKKCSTDYKGVSKVGGGGRNVLNP